MQRPYLKHLAAALALCLQLMAFGAERQVVLQGTPDNPTVAYHLARARASGLEPPLAILNVGGVANVYQRLKSWLRS